MQGIYEFSSSDRVKRFEEDLSKELRELQNAIEENDFLKVGSLNTQKSFRYVDCSIERLFIVYVRVVDLSFVYVSLYHNDYVFGKQYCTTSVCDLCLNKYVIIGPLIRHKIGRYLPKMQARYVGGTKCAFAS